MSAVRLDKEVTDVFAIRPAARHRRTSDEVHVNAADATYSYAAYGLSIRSEIELPELPVVEILDADVEIRAGAVPESLPGAVQIHEHWHVSPGALLFSSGCAGRFLITGGNRIEVDRTPGCDIDTFRMALTGTGFASLLHQRGYLTLHASAVRVGNGAAILAGRSGVGKSTLAAGLSLRGHDLIADDVAAINAPDGGRAVIRPSYPTHRLWEDGIAALGIDNGRGRRVRPELQKFHVPAGSFCTSTLPVAHVFFLSADNGDGVRISKLSPADGLKRLLDVVFRRRIAYAQGRHAADFAVTSQIARCTPMHLIQRPAGHLCIAETIERVAERLAPSRTGA